METCAFTASIAAAAAVDVTGEKMLCKDILFTNEREQKMTESVVFAIR